MAAAMFIGLEDSELRTCKYEKCFATNIRILIISVNIHLKLGNPEREAKSSAEEPHTINGTLLRI